jgi:hypothetical protein
MIFIDVFNIDNRDGSEYHRPKGCPLLYDSKRYALKARHTLRYVFPRQHGLANPFKFTSSAEIYEYQDYADREDEIEVNMHNSLCRGLTHSLGMLSESNEAN